MDLRETLKLVYKVIMILVTIGLAIGAAAAWRYSTPGNGLLLVAGILAILTLMAGLSINKLKWQDRQAETFRGIVDDVRSRFGRTDSKGNVTFNFGSGGPFNVEYPDPEVHRVDQTMLDEAKRMAASGASVDDICRKIDPDHDAHNPSHQEAFRRVVQAMIAQG